MEAKSMVKLHLGLVGLTYWGYKKRLGMFMGRHQKEREKKQKGDFSELEFFKSVYSEGDGSFKEGTTSRQFVEDATKKVQESLDNSSSSIPKVDIENEVFNQLMYQGEIPKRPLNYGFGVKQSDIFGVEGHLRKEGSYYVNNSDMEVEKLKVALLDMKKQNEDLAEQNQILNTKFDAVGSMMAQVLKATRSGNVSSEVIDNAIQLLDSQIGKSCYDGNFLKNLVVLDLSLGSGVVEQRVGLLVVKSVGSCCLGWVKINCDPLCLGNLETKQHHTQPPPRYSEASLVKKMEELGIGRPSTYASMLRVLQDRKYVTAKSRVLTPEFRGRIVSAFLSHYFNEVTDYSLTADMETELDNVSAGSTEWKGLLKDYWGRFSTYCERAGKVHIHQVEKMLERTYDNFLFSSLPEESRSCPSCMEGTLIFKVSRYGAGYFIGCDQHPKCK
uniref:Topo IA-type catalytic domain-containing protein n=1 Tax=Chenopodium quinoa TaxID=63459 RepID=A0A803LH70_CHEQI